MKHLPLILFYKLVSLLFYRGEKVNRQLFDYFPTYRAAFGEMMNQVQRLLHRTTACAVQGILIEPTNHCNLKCRHCSIQNKKNVHKGYMDFGFYTKIIDDNPQLTCIILTRNGEPFLHPRIFEMIAYARQRNIHVSLYTNGLLLNEDKIQRLFESDLSEINFSMEGVGEAYRSNRGQDYDMLAMRITQVLHQRNQRNAGLRVGINVALTRDASQLARIEEQWRGVVDYIMVEPLMMGPAAKLRTKSCKTLWRNLVVAWDGEVVPCCVDMHNTLVMGNARQQSLAAIFNGRQAQAIRRQHLSKAFPDICKYCDSHFG